MELKQFMSELASAAPTPGGGAVSALNGALAAALTSMVANLTQKRCQSSADTAALQRLLTTVQQLQHELTAQIKADAEGFAPLAQAYRLPKTQPKRAEILETALTGAVQAPLTTLKLLAQLIPLLTQLLASANQLVISDIGVAATGCSSAAQAAALTVYVNTRLMQDKAKAAAINQQTASLVAANVTSCQKIYQQVLTQLT